jgi:hypothetical protein
LAGVANAGQWIAHPQEPKSAVCHDPLRFGKSSQFPVPIGRSAFTSP